MSLFFLLPVAGPKYTLSGETILDVTTSRTATASVVVGSDGRMEKRVGSTYSQIDAATDWVIPNAAANSDHDVRITNVVWNQGSSFDSEAAAEDVWIDLSVDREWLIEDSNSGAPGSKDVDFDIEIRDSSGNVVASGSYSLTAVYDIS